ncbi:unknown protein [Microcystis aeruginosa NIES-843]|uniref:Uncharacterized protein n=1 Tax=Microcystis aeruginosa (strain NIES-843 / IAM M-2473) TaxID=449447 RepID=B0JKG5_MICAN|nr:unknown protein [Microcystis aeruginosa NIES-843]
MRSAPTTAIPEIAFAPDIRGVWRVGGTLLITSKPTKEARTNTTKAVKSWAVIG